MTWLKIAIGSVATLLTLVGTVSGAHIYLDSRYATNQAVESEAKATRAQVLRGQIWELEDKVLELQSRGQLTPYERARLDKYLRRLEEVRAKLRAIEHGG